MKNECDIVNDLLPNYVGDLLSDNTSQFVKEHLDSCQECRKLYEGMKKINCNNILLKYQPYCIKERKKV